MVDYEGEFEKIGDLIIDEHVRKFHFSFRNINVYEAFKNAIDMVYDSQDTSFTGVLDIIDTPLFNMIDRLKHGKGVDFKHDFIQYEGNNCHIPTTG